MCNPKWRKSNIPLSPSRAEHCSVFIESLQLIMVIGGYQDDYRRKSIQTIDRKHFISNWYIVKDIILLRQLWDEGRTQKRDANCAIQNALDHSDKVICMNLPGDYFKETIWRLVSYLDLDMFRAVLSFFI